jgi:protocatechuate 3,4-dioxygenase beta subunit
VILVRGRVVDTGGKPLSGALVDVWQANHHGRYDHPEDPNTAPLDPHFQGWGLIRTDAEGHYQFKTIKPGAYPLSFLGDDGWRCRHIHFKVAQDGHSELTTQMYFEGDPLIEQDRQIAKVQEELRHLLIAKPVADEASGLPLYRFDIVLQPLVA